MDSLALRCMCEISGLSLGCVFLMLYRKYESVTQTTQYMK